MLISFVKIPFGDFGFVYPSGRRSKTGSTFFSTGSSFASSSFTSDIYKPLIRKGNASDKEVGWVGRIVVLIVAIIAFVIAATGVNDPNSWANSIMAMVENAWGLFGASFGPVVILSLFWKRLNYNGAVAGIVVGAVVDVVWLIWLTAPTGIYEILPAFIIGLIATVVVSLATKYIIHRIQLYVNNFFHFFTNNIK